MAYDRNEFLEIVERESRRVTNERRRELEVAKHTGLSAKYVTGDAHWDMFLQRIEQWRREAEAERDRIEERFRLSGDCDPAHLVADKLALQVALARILTLEQVMALPKSLIEQGAEASEVLGKSTENDDEPTH